MLHRVNLGAEADEYIIRYWLTKHGIRHMLMKDILEKSESNS